MSITFIFLVKKTYRERMDLYLARQLCRVVSEILVKNKGYLKKKKIVMAMTVVMATMMAAVMMTMAMTVLLLGHNGNENGDDNGDGSDGGDGC